jgi:hypothetical protein
VGCKADTGKFLGPGSLAKPRKGRAQGAAGSHPSLAFGVAVLAMIS